MSFISLDFVVFFAVFFSVYFFLPHKGKLLWLFLSSLFFYGYFKWEYVFLILFSLILDYSVARIMGRTEAKTGRKLLLLISLSANLGLLFFFKYFNFTADSITQIFNYFGGDATAPAINVLLPIGISFYTFQTMSYTIDVYRQKLEPEPSLLNFATYVVMFPQLVAGPIERATNILPQLRGNLDFDVNRTVLGLQLILVGAFQKVVIGDRVGRYVDVVYTSVDDYGWFALAFATVLFGIQIYCDFSGYSSIAIGIAKIMGIDLMENFRQPYLAKSFREFWQRWHISLSTFFRDYVYIPLGGNRITLKRTIGNTLIVFLLSGLWHGAAWTFVIWGAIHGIVIALELLWTRRKQLNNQSPAETSTPVWQIILQTLGTFSLVMFSWLFFRANSLGDALGIIQSIGQFQSGVINWYMPFENIAPRLWSGQFELVISISLVILLLLTDAVLVYRPQLIKKVLSYTLIRWTLYYVASILIIISFSIYDIKSTFIYFQF